MKEQLSILLIEDSKIDATLIIDELKGSDFQPIVTIIETRDALARELEENTWDVILCDYNLPQWGALEALSLIQEKDPDIPCIIVSGSVSEEIIIQALKKGAGDYVMKDNLIRLVPAIEREVIAAQERRERKRIEEMLRQQEIDERFRLMAEDASSMIWMTDKAGLTIYANKAWLKATGQTLPEDTGDIWANVLPPEARHLEKAKFIKAFNARALYESEFKMKGAHGEELWLIVKGAPMFTPQKEFMGYVGTCFDVTERKQAELALRESEQRFRLLMENVREYAIFMVDPQGNILTWNKSAERVFGYAAEVMIGQPVSRLYSEADVWLSKPGYELKIALSEKYFEEEGWRIRQNGSPFWGLIHTTAVRNEVGTVLGFTQIIRDLSERMQMQEQVQHAKEKADMADLENQKKSLYFSAITHELKTPLNAIIGFSDLLKSGYGGILTEKQRRYTDNVVLSGQHLLSMVNEILDLAKIEAGRLILHPEPVNLNLLVQEVQGVVSQLGAEQDIHLRFEISDPIESLEADPVRLRQILFNLISNAVKFNRKGGWVEVKLFYSKDHQQIICTVADTGIGIPKNQLGNLFTEFYQVDSSTSRNLQGTGLGLALTKRLVELHGGSIAIESQEGIGTTVTFALPTRVLAYSG